MPLFPSISFSLLFFHKFLFYGGVPLVAHGSLDWETLTFVLSVGQGSNICDAFLPTLA
jgi:hypothetical protein